MTTSNGKLAEHIRKTVCYDAAQSTAASGGRSIGVDLQDVKVTRTGEEWGGSSEEGYFTSLHDWKRGKLKLHFEKMEERVEGSVDHRCA